MTTTMCDDEDDVMSRRSMAGKLTKDMSQSTLRKDSFEQKASSIAQKELDTTVSAKTFLVIFLSQRPRSTQAKSMSKCSEYVAVIIPFTLWH